MTLFTLLAAYIVWLVTWLSVYEEWQPRKNAFIVADVLYASATVLAFFHLAHAFQVSSTLGPLQLSLYRMLKDVAKFLFIFLMLFIAFATGLIKIYSYYVVSQVRVNSRTSIHMLSRWMLLRYLYRRVGAHKQTYNNSSVIDR